MNESKFISVCVPYFMRPHYLDKLADSVHRYADYPFELIIHDDKGSDLKSLPIKDKFSSLLLNLGPNLGLSTATNRAISCANSKYILFLNDDVEITKPCFRNIVNILESKKYIGYLSFMDYIEDGMYHNAHITHEAQYMDAHGSNFTLCNMGGHGSIMAFRKEVWQEVGGWPEYVTSGAADGAFVNSIWKRGYFRGTIEHSCMNNMSIEYNDKTRINDTSLGPYGDCQYPKVFGLNIKEESDIRFHQTGDFAWSHNTQPEDETNSSYWWDYMATVLPKSGHIDEINWDNAKKHGQSKWENEIKADIKRG
jgi:glycosyltransferase involved in cell wall biosynthesis